MLNVYFIGNQIWVQNCVNKTKVHRFLQNFISSRSKFFGGGLIKLRKFVTTLLAITRLLDFEVTTLPYPTRNWKTTTRWSLPIRGFKRKLSFKEHNLLQMGSLFVCVCNSSLSWAWEWKVWPIDLVFQAKFARQGAARYKGRQRLTNVYV